MNQELLDQLKNSVQWWGATIETTAAASIIIAAFGRDLAPEERAEALRFYAGEQWPEEVRQTRAKTNRPMLVVNRLPELVGVAIGKDYGSVGPSDVLPRDVAHSIETVKAILAIQNKDAQVLYNFTLSTFAEMQIQQERPFRIVGRT